MKAFGVVKFGDPLALFEVPEPEPGPGQVLVRVGAAGIGMWDYALGAGAFGTEFPVPYTLGWEGTGTVAALGDGVDGYEVGDAVIGYDRSTGWLAEYVVVPLSSLTHAPYGLHLLEAASLPIAGSTAVQVIDDILKVAAGETVVVAGAAGPTGYLTVQYALHRGADVIATAGPANLDYIARLGVEAVHDYEQGTAGLLTAIRAAHPSGVDVLIDCVSASNYHDLLAVVRHGGRGASITPPLAADLRADVASHGVQSSGEATTLRAVVQLVDDGTLTGHVRRAFDLADAQSAFDLLLTGHGRGKVVVDQSTANG